MNLALQRSRILFLRHMQKRSCRANFFKGRRVCCQFISPLHGTADTNAVEKLLKQPFTVHAVSVVAPHRPSTYV